MILYSDVNRNLTSQYEDVKIETNVKAIINSIENILTVVKGELPGRPEFGSDIYKFVFDLNDDLSLVGIEESTLGALERWEPRINVIDVDVNSFPNQNEVVITIVFNLKVNNIQYTTDIRIVNDQ